MTNTTRQRLVSGQEEEEEAMMVEAGRHYEEELRVGSTRLASLEDLDSLEVSYHATSRTINFTAL